MGHLSHLRLVGISKGSAGPYTTQVLADYGVDIVRIDPMGTKARQPHELVRVRGRRSIMIDVESAEGQALIERLASTADILLSEPGMDGKNLIEAPYSRLAAANPRLIYCRITGYGDDGPMADAPKHNDLVAARYGVDTQPGWRPGPTYVTAQVPNIGAGLLAFQAIGAALYHRERTGLGQEVTTSLLAGALACQPNTVSAERPAAITATRSVVGFGPFGQWPLYRIYECGDGQWLHFGCLSDNFKVNAMKALDLEDALTRLGYRTPTENANIEAIYEVIAAKMRSQPYVYWAQLFEEQDVPYSLAQHADEIMDDPQVVHEELVQRFDDPTAGSMDQMGPVLVSDAWQWEKPRPAPRPGEHTDEILREAGIADNEIAALRGKGVVA